MLSIKIALILFIKQYFGKELTSKWINMEGLHYLKQLANTQQNTSLHQNTLQSKHGNKDSHKQYGRFIKYTNIFIFIIYIMPGFMIKS